MIDVKVRRSAILGLLGTTILATAGIANAQTAQPTADAAPQAAPSTPVDNEPQNGDIVVTAQKRSESVQRVPISMQALSPEILSQHQVQSFDDYSKLLPSASFQSLGPGETNLFFRGVVTGQDRNPIGALPSTGVYLDEVPVTTTGSLVNVHIYDVARVEALSGPQGTLYGASSLAGTLRIITNKPDPSKVSAGYDVQLNKFGDGDFGGSAEGFVNVPINDRTAVRIVGFYDHEGGYIDNTFVSRTFQRPHTVNGVVVNSPLTVNNASSVKNNFNDDVTYGGRIALGIELNDDWTITPGLIAQEEHSHGTFLYDPRAGYLKVHDFTGDSASDKWYQASLAVQGKIGNWDLVYSGGYMQRRTQATADYSYYTVAYDAFPDYNFLQTASGQNISPNQLVSRDNRLTKQTHELRISSPTGERLQVTGGLFYQRQQNDFRQDFFIPGAGSSVQAPSLVVTGDDVFLTRANRVDRDYAVFAQADFKILSNLTLTGGIRGFKYRNTLVGFSGGPGTAKSLCGSYSDNCVSINKEAKDTGETHKVSLSWQVDPTKMIYATYSTGFRPGGINRPVNFAAYNPDTLDNYEIGWKTSWFDRKLRFNAAVYHEVWNGIQYALPGANGVTSIVNAGDAHITGVEADLSLKLGPLTLSTAGDYNDAKLSTPFCNLVNGVRRCDLGQAAPVGTRLPVQPQFKVNATARYDTRIGGVDAFAQISMLHQSSSTSLLKVSDNLQLGDAPAFTSFDFSFGGALSNHTTFALFIQNAFDTHGQLSRNAECVINACLANGRIYPIKPQQFGIKFGQKF